MAFHFLSRKEAPIPWLSDLILRSLCDAKNINRRRLKEWQRGNKDVRIKPDCPGSDASFTILWKEVWLYETECGTCKRPRGLRPGRLAPVRHLFPDRRPGPGHSPLDGAVVDIPARIHLRHRLYPYYCQFPF